MKNIAFKIKNNVLILALIMSLVAFTACEKVEDINNISRDNNIPNDSKTEMIIVVVLKILESFAVVLGSIVLIFFVLRVVAGLFLLTRATILGFVWFAFHRELSFRF